MTDLWIPEWADPDARVMYGGYTYEPQAPYCLVYSLDAEYVDQFYNLHMAVYTHFDRNIPKRRGGYSFILDANMYCIFGWSWPPGTPRPQTSHNRRIAQVVTDLMMGDPLIALHEEGA